MKRPDVIRSKRVAVDHLLESVRANRPGDTELLEYLTHYCRAAWHRGYDAGRNRVRKEVQSSKATV